MTAVAIPADRLYGRLLAQAAARLAAGGVPVASGVRRDDGRLAPLPLARWVAPADAVDVAVLARAEDPVLDIGCGPGRHVAALRLTGRRALGLDLSPIAVGMTRFRGAEAVLGNVFEDVPGAGTYRAALLLDGNIGIGGAPDALLRRARELLAPGGAVIAELEAPGARSERSRVRLEGEGAVSDWFSWAQVGVDDAAAMADDAHMRLDWTLHAGGRWFASMVRP
jgi:SAM-dependent methyltransferase